MRSARVLGVRVDCVDMAAALDEIERLVSAAGEGSAGGGVNLVATVNPEFVMAARRHSEFGRVLEGAALCIPDGIGVVWAMRRSGCARQDRVAGADLLPELARRCAARGWRPYLLGAADGVAEAAASRLVELAPGLRIAGTHAGSPRPEDDLTSLALIERATPDLVLVAYGHPAQELWIDRNRGRLRLPVAIGVGGSFDFLAGRSRRAPHAIRRIHLEWLWRLVREPWRARRMAVLPGYALAVLRERPS